VTELAPAQARPVERQEQRAVIQILRAGDQALHLLGAEHDREASPALRIRQVLLHVAALQHAQIEEAERGDFRDDTPHGQLPLLEQIDLVAAQIVGTEAIETPAGVSMKGPNDAEITRAGGRRVVAADEFVVQALQ
jgi:hypothetical protein